MSLWGHLITHFWTGQNPVHEVWLLKVIKILSLNRTVSGDAFPTLSSLDKPKLMQRNKCTGMNVYPAHKFLNGLNGLKRDVKRPKTTKTDDNIKKIGKLIREDRRLSIRGLAEITGYLQRRCSPDFA
ncbi:hypothetical protein NQ318_006520 [Aromia moschata]|uniref:Uncharacterized protein n=1 Tax=Aromia moschata TaxID=1265417 RepID=A0AAV8YPS1_9CUCU|nr:hypothetical protein NQ318_006520 [Aromia moschata]